MSAVDEVAPGTVRQNPETLAVAIKTALPGAPYAWFVFHPSNGGHYTDGSPEKLDTWPPLVPDSE